MPNPGLIKHQDINIGGLFRVLAVITVKSRFSFRFLPRMCPAVCVCALCCPCVVRSTQCHSKEKGLGLFRPQKNSNGAYLRFSKIRNILGSAYKFLV